MKKFKKTPRQTTDVSKHSQILCLLKDLYPEYIKRKKKKKRIHKELSHKKTQNPV